MLRAGATPLTGREAAREQIPKGNLTLKTKALGGDTAADFIYTRGGYAQFQNGKSEKGYFARIWKRESKGWRISCDPASAIAAPPPKEP